ncbi:hypothetical protein RI844_07710 [Thalassotalea fonticola]|uniref:DNA polymerase III subunit psi n=1 Tax=Thalassotalea fonticola TaxID=3065649 RepID=A0ABZ0GTS9_9GAMM|nr:hypothetical protein RI844_07710 [Colwelliaceae bacterium S1-1]
MNISERQFQYLHTMGVSLWQSRAEFFPKDNLPQTEVEKVSSEPKVADTNNTIKAAKNVEQESEIKHNFDNIEQFLTHPLSADILLALNCDKSKASLTTTGVQLDGLLWQFNSDDKCDYYQQTLNTPNLDQLTKDNNLKVALWACLCSHLNDGNN